MPNKVKFNLKNVHYCVLSDSGYASTVKALPGGVSLSLDPQGDIEKFYADGIVYYQTSANNGYEGSLELALIPDDFRKDVLAEEVSENGLLVEKADVELKKFALGFQIDGDSKNRFYWFYNCSATRPNVSANTTETSKTPQTDTLGISCIADANGVVRARSTDTYTGTAETWFESVVVPTWE